MFVFCIFFKYSFGKEPVIKEVLILVIVSVKANVFIQYSVLMRNCAGFIGKLVKIRGINLADDRDTFEK